MDIGQESRCQEARHQDTFLLSVARRPRRSIRVESPHSQRRACDSGLPYPHLEGADADYRAWSCSAALSAAFPLFFSLGRCFQGYLEGPRNHHRGIFWLLSTAAFNPPCQFHDLGYQPDSTLLVHRITEIR